MCGLNALLYRKCLRLSISSAHASTAATGGGKPGGKAGSASVVNLAQNDTKRVGDALTFLHFGWSSMIDISVVVLFLLLEIGVSALVGIGVILFMLPLQIMFAKKVGALMRLAAEKTVRCTT